MLPSGNQPFSQPGRFHRQHEDHAYPGDQFPGSGHAGPAMLGHAETFFKPSANAVNMLDYGALCRALLVALDAWASSGTPPPASRFPRAGDGTLVSPQPREGLGFPDIAGVHYTGLVNEYCQRTLGVVGSIVRARCKVEGFPPTHIQPAESGELRNLGAKRMPS